MENQKPAKSHFYDFLDLRKDIEQPHLIDQSIRSGVRVVGTNLWVLIFAILIASVGLNVNSTAVIIGAMLISPLMGPIVGIGYGAGINDFSLIKLSLKNLGIFTFISILTSTFYFTLSPLDTVTPELLARTSPNLWDVLIAFFGGSAGIIALTRKSISNVVPGVAIATALMPPLCTAGFGIAKGHWDYFGGAFFLYCINSVFIACSTWGFIKLLRLPKHAHVDESTTKRTNFVIATTILLMILPSSYLAYNLVQRNSFNEKVEQVVSSSYNDPNYVVLSHETDTVKREVYLTIGGENPPRDLAKRLEEKFYRLGLENTSVIVRYSGSGQVDMGSLKNELRQDLFNSLQTQVENLSSENKKLKTKISEVEANNNRKQSLFSEIRAQYPSIGELSISTGFLEKKSSANGDEKKLEKNITLVVINTNQSLSDEDKKRLNNWLKIRFKDKMLKMIYLDDSTSSTNTNASAQTS